VKTQAEWVWISSRFTAPRHFFLEQIVFRSDIALPTSNPQETSRKPDAGWNMAAFIVVAFGNILTTLGCLGLILGVIGIVEFDFFALGPSSGLRVLGVAAVSGCLISAVIYGISEIKR